MSMSSTGSWSRRELLGAMGAVVAATLTGCAPARILLGASPAEFKQDTGLDDRILRAFVTAVIPGIPLDTPHLARIYGDKFYRFRRYRTFFAGDLWRRGRTLFGGRPFDGLSLAERTAVIQDGLRADTITRKLYNGAIVLAQVATYGGIYTENGDVPLIDYHGFQYGAGDAHGASYPDPERFLAPRLALDGNPA